MALAFSTLVHAEASRFTPPSGLTFSGKDTVEDLFRKLELDFYAARRDLELFEISRDAQVVFWTWGAAQDTVPKSVEIHLDAGPWLVVDAATARAVTYLRYGQYWVSPGRPEESAPAVAKTKEAAIPEADATRTAAAWMDALSAPGLWKVAAVEYKDRFDATPGDLYGTWWDIAFERVHAGYPVRGLSAAISVEAESGRVMRALAPTWTPPDRVDIYFPVPNARLQAQNYLEDEPKALEELADFGKSTPEQSILDAGGNFAVKDPAASKPAKKNRIGKKAKGNDAGQDDEAAKEGDATKGSVDPNLRAMPPALTGAEPTLAIVPVREVYKQHQWQPIDPAKPGPHYALAYEFPTHTETAPTKPVLVLTATDEVAR